MAHFAQLNSNNEVIQVIVVGDDDCKDSQGNEKEEIGISFCKSLFGQDTRWVQTSYSNKFRGTFAGPGMYYDEDSDTFTAAPEA